ncbi:MAG: ABC transporter permease subunit [Lachnospiraceae bacterium]|nr:ABC transporter permease subunit [Lachnospiraceae bacterium]
MNKLLRANFSRLFKSKVFWICLSCMFVPAAYSVGIRAYNRITASENAYQSPDGLLFMSGVYLPVVIAVLIGIYIGTEYSDGTLRNKLIIGHSRVHIYIANLIVSVTTVLVLNLVYMAVIVCAGIPLVGKFTTPVNVLVKCFLCENLSVLAITAISLFVSMRIQSKSTGSILAIIVSVGLLFGSSLISISLEEPEYIFNDDVQINTYVESENSSENEENVTLTKEKNPDYLTGTRRKMYEFLDVFLPSSHLFKYEQYVEKEAVSDDIGAMSVCSCIIFVAISICGIFVFRQQNVN